MGTCQPFLDSICLLVPDEQWQLEAGSSIQEAKMARTLKSDSLEECKLQHRQGEPAYQHLKEGMVIHILAHIIQVIVLAASSDALHPRQASHPAGSTTVCHPAGSVLSPGFAHSGPI